MQIFILILQSKHKNKSIYQQNIMIKHTLLYFCLLISLFSCRNQSNTTDILTSAENIIKISPDSAIKTLNKIDNPEELEGLEKADYWRLKASVNYLSEKAMTEDSLILYSLQYYKNNQIINKLVETYNPAACYLAWGKKVSASILLLKEGIKVAKQNKNNSKVANFYMNIANLEINKNLYSAALLDFKRSLVYSGNKKAEIYYNIGICYAYLSQIDSTKSYIDKSIKAALNEKDTHSASHFLRNYADILFSNNDYQGAIVRLKQSLSLFPSVTSPNLFCTTVMCYLSLNKLDSAKYYSNQAKYILNKRTNVTNTNSFITSRNVIMGLDAIIEYQQTKKVDLFNMSRFNDSIMSDIQNKQLIISEKTNLKNQLEQQNLKLKVSKQHTQIILLSGFLF